jgi:transposase-like protein
MGAEAAPGCGRRPREYGAHSPDRTNTRNGCGRREWDNPSRHIEMAMPKLRTGSYFGLSARAQPLARATALRWASMVALIITAMIFVTACCFVWLDPR